MLPEPAASTAGRPGLAGEIRRIEAALAAGRTFAAVDLARACLDDKSLGGKQQRRSVRWLLVLALLQGGAVAAARAAVEALEATPPRPIKGADGERRARAFEALWRASGDAADLDQALAIRLARARAGGFAEQARAALLAKAKGETVLAERLAATALATTDAADPDRRLERVRLALVLGRNDDAAQTLALLAQALEAQPLQRSAARDAISALAAYGVAVPPGLLDPLPPPHVVIYCGARDPGLADQPAVADAIGAALDAVEAEIAYGSAAAGADLLLAEAVLARGAELNLVLPCAVGAFRKQLVAPAGAAWTGRFDAVVAAATSLISVADDRQTADGLGLEFGNRVIDGTARLRAAQLSAQPYLIAACDPLADGDPGGAGDFIDHWGDPARLRLVDLDELGVEPDSAAAITLPATLPAERIAGLLFADVVGFSRLDDALLPQFWRFMAAVAGHMQGDVAQPWMLRSWGDAVFVVTDTALATADYAMALQAAFAAIDARAFGLPTAMELRIGCHAGPIFEGRHPLTAETMVYGGNVNRAARIEPITVPGRVYASAPFVAWLTAEESAAEAESRLEGVTYRPRYRCTDRGIVELAKRYGPQAVYEVAPWRPARATHDTRVEGRRLTMTLANDLAEHSRLAAELVRFITGFGFAETDLLPFEIAFDEILTNICRYAWTDAGQHSIEVAATLADDRLTVTFTDDGHAFDPLETVAPELDHDIEEREMGGLGIHLVRELMDEVRYTREGDTNRLTLSKRLGEATTTADAHDAAMGE